MMKQYRYFRDFSGDDPIDIKYRESFYLEVSSGIIDHYFRASLSGYGYIPVEGPVILASNHSGNAFPHDSFVLDQLLWREGGFGDKAKIKPLYSPKLALSWWMRPFGLDNWWRKFGAVDQTYLNFDRILDRGGRVIYYPEGIPGIGKGFNRRYRLQRFQPSFVKLAARHNVPVLPVYGINAEWINPASMTFRWIDRLSSRLTGIPFIPLPLIILAVIFPFFFYFAFPCQMKFFIGKPIDVRARVRETGLASDGNPDRGLAEKIADQIRHEMQRELDRLVAIHGKKPYNFASLIRAFKGIRGRRWLTSPLGWPILFTRHYRDFHDRQNNRPRLGRWRRDWDLIVYYLPLGWILLTLIRTFRKPPYGYRGLSKEEKIRQEGRYVWSIARQNGNTDTNS